MFKSENKKDQKIELKKQDFGQKNFFYQCNTTVLQNRCNSGCHQTLDLYIKCFRKHEIMKLDQKLNDNISCEKRASIQSLKRNKNVIIKRCCKGGATVILNRYDYIKEGKNQLNHQQNYQPLSLDPTKNFKLKLTKLIKSFPDPHKYQLLSYIPPNPQPGKFYLLSKIHKPNNPGRSIISNNNTLTELLSHFVETLLKPYAQAANSFIQDTTDFLNKLKKIKIVLQNTILATLEVSSLYTSITHNNGLKALKNRLPDNQLTDMIIQSTKFILKRNYFNFGNQQFLQLKSTAMGIKMAPQYANIFMATWKKTFYKTPIINH